MDDTPTVHAMLGPQGLYSVCKVSINHHDFGNVHAWQTMGLLQGDAVVPQVYFDAVRPSAVTCTPAARNRSSRMPH